MLLKPGILKSEVLARQQRNGETTMSEIVLFVHDALAAGKAARLSLYDTQK